MTISSENKRNTYNGDGVTTVFAYTFKILAQGDILVQWKVESTGVITTKTITTHYTVSGVAAAAGGNVTFTAGNEPPTGTTVILTRNMAGTQLVDYTEYDSFPAETHETALDRLTMLHLQQSLLIDQSLKLDNGVTTFTTTIGAPDAAGAVLVSDTANTGFEWATALSIGDSLSKADGTFYVGDGTTIVAESGATARASMGVTIGTHVQAYDADLAAIAGLTSAADKGIMFTGSGTAATYTLTAAALTVLDDATVAAMVDTLGGASSSGTGGLARLTSASFVTPLLGTPTSGNLSNCTAYPLSALTGAAAGVLTFLATPSSANLASAVTDETGTGALVFANTPTLVTPILGTPTSGNLSNCTAYALSALTGAGANVLTFLATPSSANLAAALTDETGTGANVFANTPTLVTPLLGTPTSGTLTNCTGLPEAGLTLADNTTNDASTTKHGFLKKLNNTATSYMDGQGNWSTPSGTGPVGAFNSVVRQVFTSSGTYTPTADMVYCEVIVVGGGGSGGSVTGGTAGQAAAAGGGAGGGISSIIYTATEIGADAVVTIGAAGAAPSSGANDGNAGGTSSFNPAGTGATITATGGAGGAHMTKSASAKNSASTIGGEGGGSGGTININGSPGGYGATLASAALCLSGKGGDSAGFGIGGLGYMFTTFNNPGRVGTGYGAGGSGASDNGNADFAGGAGTAGICIVTEYISS